MLDPGRFTDYGRLSRAKNAVMNHKPAAPVLVRREPCSWFGFFHSVNFPVLSPAGQKNTKETPASNKAITQYKPVSAYESCTGYKPKALLSA